MIVGIDARLGLWRGRGWGRYCSDFLLEAARKHDVEWRALLPDTPEARDLERHLNGGVSVVFDLFAPATVAEAPLHAMAASDPYQHLGGVDVLHVLTRFVPQTTIRPVVATVHDIAPLSDPPFKPEVRAATLAALERIRRQETHMVAVSAFTASELVSQPNLDLKRIHVVHSGVHELGGPHLPAVRTERRPTLLYVGGAGANKNLPRLLEAVTRLRRSLDVELVLAGDPAWGYAELASEFRAAPWIRSEGLVPDERLATLYAEADVLVFPSLHEGFGLPLLEAMATATPICCSRIPVFQEIAGAVASYFDPHDPDDIADTIRNVLEQIGDGGRESLGLERVRAFGWSRAVDETIAVYRTALVGTALAHA